MLLELPSELLLSKLSNTFINILKKIYIKKYTLVNNSGIDTQKYNDGDKVTVVNLTIFLILNLLYLDSYIY